MKQMEESSSFLKKRTKKLFSIWPVLVKPPVAQMNKSFCALFSKSAS
jgi:hypothetical protein